MNLENLKTKINAEEDIEKIGEYVRVFSLKNKEFLDDLIPVLNEKLNVEEDVLKISECIRLIALGDPNVAYGVIPVLKDKLEAEEDIGKISKCIITVSHGGPDVAKNLVESFDLEKIRDEIKEEEDLERIGFKIWYLALGSSEFAEKLIKIVKNKVKKERNIGKIIECVRLIALPQNSKNFGITRTSDSPYGSEKFAEKLIPVFRAKIEAEEDIGKICWYIKRISDGSKHTAQKLIEQLDPGNAKNPDVKKGIIELKKGKLVV